ncbi:MAG TPA: lysylphosphatidylglycerol synthase transmembrane domain-containing protein [Flavipsychrobacter sp.]|nr:lysylphosphatidylglycerol synthase transmembrane domain-containing protein [Flavipsychrobacter sp.]
MKKIVLTTLQYVIFFGLGGLLIWWQYGKLSPSDKTEIFASFAEIEDKLWLLIPVLLVGFLSHLFRALRWKLLLQPLKLNPTTTNITFAVLIGYLVNLLVPRMGEVARCSVLAKYENEPVDKIVGTIVAERSFDMVCLILVTVLAFVLQMDIASEYVNEQMAKFSITGTTLAIVFGGIALFIALLIFIFRKNRKSKIGQFITNIGYGILSIKFMQKKGQFLLYTALIWFCYLALVFIGFKAIDATEHLGWMPALSVLVFGSLGMIVTPGGIGAYPPAVQLVLVKLYAVKSSYALAFGWVSWMAQTSIVLVLGLLSVLLLPIYNVKRHGQNKLDHQQDNE